MRYDDNVAKILTSDDTVSTEFNAGRDFEFEHDTISNDFSMLNIVSMTPMN